MKRSEAIEAGRALRVRLMVGGLVSIHEATALWTLIEIAERAARGVIARQGQRSERTRKRAASRAGTSAWAGMSFDERSEELKRRAKRRKSKAGKGISAPSKKEKNLAESY